MTTPYWVQDAIFYQIFPDRFANGDVTNDPPNLQKWGSPPNIWGFQGGDLRGILRHIDYLLDVGVNAIYLNPIFLASSNHRYNTSDYFQIDPRLGNLSDFHALVDAVHKNGMRIILDGVFNHCGRGFFAFSDVMENEEKSAYKDWFHIKQFPLDAYSKGEAKNYVGWWNHKSLPKFNTDNPKVREYLLNVARIWIERGADGWRLDVPNEIDDDGFWKEFRHVVKSANRDAYITGEIWNVDPRWANETHFDGLLNYPVKDALEAFFLGNDDSQQFANRIDEIINAYPRENLFAMFVPLDSHDTERFKTLMAGDTNKLKLAFLFQMAFPGAPALYYGDEIGMEGGKDPDSRRAFPWQQSKWDKGLLQWVKSLISIRKRTPSLRRGNYVRLMSKDQLYVFARTLGDRNILIPMNASGKTQKIDIPCAGLAWADGREVRSLIHGQAYDVSSGNLSITLPPWSGDWIG